MPYLLHAVVRSGTETADLDTTGESLRSLTLDDLAVVATEVADDREVSDDDAVRHLEVQTALVDRGPVLALRFGTVAPDEDTARAEVLEPAADELRRRLETVTGYAELRLDLRFDEQAVLRELLESDPVLAARARDTDVAQRIGAGEAIAGAVASWCVAQGDALAAPLADVVEAVRRLEVHEPYVERFALLVRTDRLAEVDAVVGELADQVEVEYVGPLPVLTFLEELTAAPQEPEKSSWGW